MKANIKGLLRTIFFLICLSVCIYEIIQCLNKMLKDPTTTIIFLDEFGKHGVPSITLCPYSNHLDNASAYNHKILLTYGLTPKEYSDLNIWNTSTITPEDLYEEITWQLEDIIDKVSYSFQNTSEILNGSSDKWKSMWTSVDKKWEGRCYTFNPPTQINGVGLVDISFVSKFPFDLELTFHAKHQSSDKDLDGISFVAKSGLYYELEVPVDIIINRNTKTRPCIGNSENFDANRNKVALEKMIEEVDCVVPFMNRNGTKASICQNVTFAKTAVEILEAHGKFYDLYNWIDVPLPCMQIFVDPRKTFDTPAWFNQTKIKASFLKMSKITQQREAYPFHSFYAEVGGFVGLLLGVSIYQLADLMDLIPCISVSHIHSSFKTMYS